MSREIIERFFSLFLKQSVKRTFLCRIAAALDWPVLAPWCVSVAISLPRKLRLLNGPDPRNDSGCDLSLTEDRSSRMHAASRTHRSLDSNETP
jgi:hypothetical protein